MITYHAIGIVECPVTEPLRPEVIRAQVSRLALAPQFTPALADLAVGRYLWVIYHLHQAQAWQEQQMPELFRRRIACRPNAIGLTLTRIVGLTDSTITVVGLDAINGTPILDIKPYQPLFDAPPVHPAERVP